MPAFVNKALVNRIESSVERVASALFAASVGFAAYSLLPSALAQPALSACSGGAAILAFLLAGRGQRALQPAPRFPVPIFDVRGLDPAPADELVLTEDDRYVRTDAEEGPLVLDDILAQVTADSRVVHLFDPAAMPTPGQLRARIDTHLASDATVPDASQALSEALAELRRSLR